ncbi:MAG: histidine phosphatase family protein [Pseudomonadota bacterium]
MADLFVLRHAQASFGSAQAGGYDKLSALGEAQSRQVGATLKAAGIVPDRLITGTLTRQRDTLSLMGFDGPVEAHAGFDEYDFHDLLHTRFDGDVPEEVLADRRTHFRTLRETLRIWQAGGLGAARESWAEFTARVEAARQQATRPGAKTVVAISSGGVIGQLVAKALEAPDETMIALNLQMKNTSITRFIYSDTGRFFLNEFNATPHFFPAEQASNLTYS